MYAQLHVSYVEVGLTGASLGQKLHNVTVHLHRQLQEAEDTLAIAFQSIKHLREYVNTK